MFGGGDTVLVAVSGGADSVALLDVLSALARPLDLKLHALHVHHGLRAEAEPEADFVRAFCRELAVPFHLERVAVRRVSVPGADPPWQGLEAEARRARYGAFRACAAAVGASAVATGHTADDQAETVLMRLLQGAGPRGLGGIAPVRRPYVRPLLERRRAEVEAHLRARGLSWVEDASNRDPAFLRNRIRHDLVPFLVERWDPALAASLGRAATVARGVVADLEQRAGAALDRLARPEGGALVLSLDALRRLPEELAAEVLRQGLIRLDPRRATLRAPGERALRRVLGNEALRRPLRLGRVRIERSGRWLRVGGGPRPGVAPRAWQVPGRLVLEEVGLSLEARCLTAGADYRPPRERSTVAFDADRIPSRLTVRGRRPGDRFEPFGGPGVRRLKSFLIDAEVPRWDRARIPLLEADGEIVWVAGLRRGAAAPVTSGTRRILEVTLRAPLAVPPLAE